MPCLLVPLDAGGGCGAGPARCRRPPRAGSGRCRPRSARRRHRRPPSWSSWAACVSVGGAAGSSASAGGGTLGARRRREPQRRRGLARSLRAEPAHDLAVVVDLQDLEGERRALAPRQADRAGRSARARSPVSSRPRGAVSVARRTLPSRARVVSCHPRSATPSTDVTPRGIWITIRSVAASARSFGTSKVRRARPRRPGARRLHLDMCRGRARPARARPPAASAARLTARPPRASCSCRCTAQRRACSTSSRRRRPRARAAGSPPPAGTAMAGCS